MILRVLFSCLMLLGVFCCAGNFAMAEDDRRLPREDVYYSKMQGRMTLWYTDAVDEILRKRDAALNKVAALRSYYPYTKQFKVFSAEVTDQMTREAYTYETSTDAGARFAALKRYNALVRDHLPNLDVLDLAYTYAKNNPTFGNAGFFASVRKEVQKSIFDVFLDGRSAETAFEAMSMSEESYIIARLGLDVLSSEIYPVGSKYYDVHQVRDRKTSEEYTLFIDVSAPLGMSKKIHDLQKEKSKKDISKF